MSPEVFSFSIKLSNARYALSAVERFLTTTAIPHVTCCQKKQTGFLRTALGEFFPAFVILFEAIEPW